MRRYIWRYPGRRMPVIAPASSTGGQYLFHKLYALYAGYVGHWSVHAVLKPSAAHQCPGVRRQGDQVSSAEQVNIEFAVQRRKMLNAKVNFVQIGEYADRARREAIRFLPVERAQVRQVPKNLLDRKSVV